MSVNQTRKITPYSLIALISIVIGVIFLLSLNTCGFGKSSTYLAGNSIPPAQGAGVLKEIDFDNNTFTIKALDCPQEGNSSICNNATEDGLITLSISDNEMSESLATNFSVGDTVYVYYPMSLEIISDDGQIICSSISHLKN